MATRFWLTDTGWDTAALTRAMANAEAGGFVCFEGWVRNSNEGKEVLRLEYQAYPELALHEGAAILDEACRKFPVLDIHCVHRTGLLEIGEGAVWVGVAAPHRSEAFAACHWVIDQVKHRVPIWNLEHYADGSRDWVSCHRCMAALSGADHHH